MNGSIAKGCRMTPEVFEKVFIPSFKNFSFYRAFKTAEKLLESQDSERVTTQLVRSFNAQQIIKKQPISIKKYIAAHSYTTRVECMINDLIAISRSPKEFITPCCDAGIDVFIYKGMVHAVPLSHFIKEYKLPNNVEDFSYSPDNVTPEWGVRKETWQKLYKSGKMRMELINASKSIGIEEIKKHFLELPQKVKKEEIKQEQPEETQAA